MGGTPVAPPVGVNSSPTSRRTQWPAISPIAGALLGQVSGDATDVKRRSPVKVERARTGVVLYPDAEQQRDVQ
jgi:hypothetical protein